MYLSTIPEGFDAEDNEPEPKTTGDDMLMHANTNFVDQPAMRVEAEAQLPISDSMPATMVATMIVAAIGANAGTLAPLRISDHVVAD